MKHSLTQEINNLQHKTVNEHKIMYITYKSKTTKPHHIHNNISQGPICNS
jgi:hypothetical protein